MSFGFNYIYNIYQEIPYHLLFKSTHTHLMIGKLTLVATACLIGTVQSWKYQGHILSKSNASLTAGLGNEFSNRLYRPSIFG